MQHNNIQTVESGRTQTVELGHPEKAKKWMVRMFDNLGHLKKGGFGRRTNTNVVTDLGFVPFVYVDSTPAIQITDLETNNRPSISRARKNKKKKKN